MLVALAVMYSLSRVVAFSGDGNVIDELPHRIARAIEEAAHCFNRLVIVAGPTRSGKTLALQSLMQVHGWPIVNLNLLLTERLLQVATGRRALHAGRFVGEIVSQQRSGVLLVDNTEALFDPGLMQDALRLLAGLSRDRTIVATWRGCYDDGVLTYAATGHPEYRCVNEVVGIVVSSNGGD